MARLWTSFSPALVFRAASFLVLPFRVVSSTRSWVVLERPRSTGVLHRHNLGFKRRSIGDREGNAKFPYGYAVRGGRGRPRRERGRGRRPGHGGGERDSRFQVVIPRGSTPDQEPVDPGTPLVAPIGSNPGHCCCRELCTRVGTDPTAPKFGRNAIHCAKLSHRPSGFRYIRGRSSGGSSNRIRSMKRLLEEHGLRGRGPAWDRGPSSTRPVASASEWDGWQIDNCHQGGAKVRHRGRRSITQPDCALIFTRLIVRRTGMAAVNSERSVSEQDLFMFHPEGGNVDPTNTTDIWTNSSFLRVTSTI